MKKVIVISGTPCAGKTTISQKLARKLKRCELISANDIVKKNKLFSGYGKEGEMIVKMGELRKEIERRIRKSTADVVIIEGHLLCDLKVKQATAIIIREHLATLLKRMNKRGYSKKKIEGNIVSEAIDYCGVNATSNYNEVYEIQSGPEAVSLIISIIKNGKTKLKDIEMLPELDGLLKKLSSY